MNIPPIPTITVFERSPDGGQGLARDIRVRWAEEVGQPHSVRPVSFATLKEAAHKFTGDPSAGFRRAGDPATAVPVEGVRSRALSDLGSA